MPKIDDVPSPVLSPPVPSAERNGDSLPPSPAKSKPRKKEPVVLDPIIYTEIKTKLCLGEKALTFEQAKQLMRWETEEDYKARVTKEGAGKNNPSVLVGYGDDFMLKDKKGRKIRCWANTKNRPFAEPWAKGLSQEILHSGPDLPIEKRRWHFNGETIIIGNRGQVLSAQHRLTGFILACEEWAMGGDKWKRIWPKMPTLECLIVVGVPEEDYVLRTLDNVKPRTFSDVIYTSDVYIQEKKEKRWMLSRYLSSATNLLWKRTGAGDQDKYRTHGAALEFLDRHKRLLDCIKHIADQDGDRLISGLKLEPGNCAALMYLMATAKSDSDKYQKSRSDKALNWELLDQAEAFWNLLVTADGKERKAIKERLGTIVTSQAIEDEESLGGRNYEKYGIIVKAWNLFMEGKAITSESVKLEYAQNPKSKMLELVEYPTCGGIDQGDEQSGGGEAPAVESAEATKERIRKENEAKMSGTVNATRAAEAKKADELKKAEDARKEQEAKTATQKAALNKTPAKSPAKSPPPQTAPAKSGLRGGTGK